MAALATTLTTGWSYGPPTKRVRYPRPEPLRFPAFFDGAWVVGCRVKEWQS
jgi:hypothetical protein